MADIEIKNFPTVTSAALTDKTVVDDGVTSSIITLDDLRKVIQPYDIYTAKITQAGVAAPSVVESQSTLSAGVVYSYVGVGIYRGTLVGAFSTTIKFFAKAVQISPTVGFTITWISADVFEIRSYVAAVLTNDQLSNSPMEIKIYY